MGLNTSHEAGQQIKFGEGTEDTLFYLKTTHVIPSFHAPVECQRRVKIGIPRLMVRQGSPRASAWAVRPSTSAGRTDYFQSRSEAAEESLFWAYNTSRVGSAVKPGSMVSGQCTQGTE